MLETEIDLNSNVYKRLDFIKLRNCFICVNNSELVFRSTFRNFNQIQRILRLLS